ncbi:pilus assembly protein [Rhodopseudomonas sp. HC1]|uniref:TadE/TadG family type IV pilus assembly protein n=1 Tax=Rhodopseudomonas infernalis TaxID=2897386 RepID=UPI001EE98741|nr:TadE/TadG family type IV pilus assembly protein [Rhodopseudomonas infernalis]MCG6204250.1 pilus assembly protein [Rhodopseudomonas infernalis]
MRFDQDDRGATAVEFAMILPVFLTIVFGIVTFGSYLAIVHGVQQLAAEAARKSVAGLTDAERSQLATGYVTSSVGSYPLLEPAKIDVVAGPSPAPANAYIVTIKYDGSSDFLFSLPFVPRPPFPVTRSAVIPYGGF